VAGRARGCFREEEVGQAQVGGQDAPLQGERGLEGLRRPLPIAAPGRLFAHGGLEVAQHQAVVGLAQARDAGLQVVGLPPLVLLLVELLQADEGMDVVGVAVDHLRQRPRRAVQKAGLAEVRAQGGERVGALRPRQVLALQEGMMHLDGALHLPVLPQQVPEDLGDLYRVGVVADDLGELGDRELELSGAQVVKALGVVGRGPKGGALAEVAAPEGGRPGAAGQEAADGGQEDGEEGGVVHRPAVSRRASRSWRPGARPSRRAPSGSPR
jgi:hypothetical protein